MAMIAEIELADLRNMLDFELLNPVVEIKTDGGGGGHGDEGSEFYDGVYTVTPCTNKQILETKDKIMSKDITVESIPYHETTNAHGTTVVIAS